MVTTPGIAEDVYLTVRELARLEKKTAWQVLSEFTRRGLQATHRDTPDEEPEEFFGFRPLPKRGVVVTNEPIGPTCILTVPESGSFVRSRGVGHHVPSLSTISSGQPISAFSTSTDLGS